MRLNKAQQRSLKDLWRGNPNGKTYLQLRRETHRGVGMNDMALVMWCGMLVGIDTDGSRHT
jgi:hypothetical protein